MRGTGGQRPLPTAGQSGAVPLDAVGSKKVSPHMLRDRDIWTGDWQGSGFTPARDPLKKRPAFHEGGVAGWLADQVSD